MRPGERAVAAARAATGARFRLHGRDVTSGLDCVGLAALALRAEGFGKAVPSGYALRSGQIPHVVATLTALGLEQVRDARPGDLVLLDAGPGQLHFAIQTDTGMIHADAVLRRVIERADLPWPVIGRWRLAEGD